MGGWFHISHVRPAEFFNVLKHVVQLLLKELHLGFSQIDPSQPRNVRDIEP